MSDSDSSALSSVPSEVENDLQLTKKNGILKFFTKAPKPGAVPKAPKSPPRPKRDPSPAHEFVLADNGDIAFIVMFRSRFDQAFPKSLPNFGPQELERGVVDIVPGEPVELLLCALLGLLLNRKQDVKPGHYNRALEEAVSNHKTQWAKSWAGKNPLSGGATFTSMSPTERLTLLKTLILWALSSSDVIKGIITASYKQNRHDDDLNQPLSVQPWGMDSDKRRYFLVEGLDDTNFRVYRESNYTGTKRTWWSVAGDIEELKTLTTKLEKEDGSLRARQLGQKMTAAIPRFEATEEKRKRREYRQIRKQQFKRPEINSYMYEGRTRGKRMKYTYSDDEEGGGVYSAGGFSDATSNRRSTRNTRGNTPADGLVPAPTITLSGRQVKSRQGGLYGETILSGAQNVGMPIGGGDGTSEEPEDGEPVERGRRRATVPKPVSNGWGKKKAHIEGYNSVDEMDSDEDDASEQDYGDDEEEDDNVPLESDNDSVELSDNEDEDMEDEPQPKKSLIIKLPIKTPTPEKKTILKLKTTPTSEKTPEKKSPIPEKKTIIKLRLSPEHKTRLAVPSLGLSNGTGSSGSSAQTAAVNSLHPVDLDSEMPDISTQTDTITSPPGSPLVFRGSPDKQRPFPSSIGVTCDGL